MRSGMADALFIVVCVCLMPVALWAQVDANTPWDPNTHLAPYPWAMARTTHFAYREGPELPWTPTSVMTMEFAGRIAVTDPNGLIGLCTETMDNLVLDEVGEPINTRGTWPNPISYEPVQYASTRWYPSGETTWDVEPYVFSVKMSVNADTSYPSVLSRIEWSMFVLLSDSIKAIDLPFAPSEDWVELAPGLEILVEKTSIEEDRYEHESTIILDPNRISYPHRGPRPLGEEEGLQGYLWPKRGLPDVIVLEIDVLNAEGNSIQNYGEGGRGLATHGSGDIAEGRRTETVISFGSGRDAAAFIRYVIAFKPYRQEVRLVLEDVPTPGL
ncbi:MAG: hypothetical protein JSW27_17035 [Phycisphaerales bacterium]|nr:MAG: hypothetical protein JSW27_17035 [Phycisphaerales bacterium]